MGSLLILISLVFGFFGCGQDGFKRSIPIIKIYERDSIQWDKKMKCDIVYFEGKDSIEIGAKVKWRGGWSRVYPKKSFAIELKTKLTLADIAHDDDWILNANFIDKTFVRHNMSYDLFKAMGEGNLAAGWSYAMVEVNDSMQGLYVLMEEVNAGMVGVEKEDSLGMILKDPPIFRDKKPDSVATEVNFYQQKYPKIHNRDDTKYIESFMDFMFETTDEEFAESLDKWVDVENIIDWHLLLLFSNNSDGILKNFYLYKLDSDSPFRMVPWDYDHSFGRDGDNELNMIRPLNCDRAILLKRLMENNAQDYVLRLHAEWERLKAENILSYEWVDNYLKRSQESLREAILVNNAMWPTDGWFYKDHNTYEQELDLIRDFVRQRIPEVDEYLAKAVAVVE